MPISCLILLSPFPSIVAECLGRHTLWLQRLRSYLQASASTYQSRCDHRKFQISVSFSLAKVHNGLPWVANYLRIHYLRRALKQHLTLSRPLEVPGIFLVIAPFLCLTFYLDPHVVKPSKPYARLRLTNIIDELLLNEEESRINESAISQPACTALQVALVDLLAEWNIKPSVVIGHSSGEIAVRSCHNFVFVYINRTKISLYSHRQHTPKERFRARTHGP